MPVAAHSSQSTHFLDPEKLLATFQEMVRLDSPSGHEGPMREYLMARFGAMGLEGKVDRRGNITFRVSSHGATHSHVLMVSGHMDVVPPCLGVQPRVHGEGLDRIISSDNTTVLGADDKSALAVIVEVMERVMKEDLRRPDMRLVFTVDEECGLDGAKHVPDEELDADFSLIFDHTGDMGMMIHEAPTLTHYEVTWTGKSVHAGIMPEKGVNAITVASQALTRFPQGQIDDDTTANLGTFKGGKGTNIVPDSVTLIGELRSHRPAKIDELLDGIRATLKQTQGRNPESDYTLEVREEFRHYCTDKKHRAIGLMHDAIKEAGLKPYLTRSNGGSDNNIFCNRGVPGVVMSAGYVDPHTLQEQVRLGDMVQCGDVLSNVLECFAAYEFA